MKEYLNTKDRASPHFQTPRKKVEKTMLSGLFLTSFEAFENVVEPSLIFSIETKTKEKMGN